MTAIRYTDGHVTIRRLEVGDLDADLEAKDTEQIDWLWEPGQRARWESMAPREQREHARRGLEERRRSFGLGPKWCFAVDTIDTPYVAYVDCDLDSPHVPRGQANVAYSAHPAHRGHGHVSAGVRLPLLFLEEHTDASEAHVIVDRDNVASLRVARAIGATVVERWVDARGRVMLRHVVAVR